MLGKLLAAVGITLAAGGSTTATELYKPYAESHVNFLYSLLFCDDINLFRKQGSDKDIGLLGTLLAEQPEGSIVSAAAKQELKAANPGLAIH